jgi:DNA-binding winged helix-turn-helix (wHTH) protein
LVQRFGEFELDGERCQLRRSGHVLAVQPRVFDLLRYLVDAGGRVVSREELLAQIWADVHVAESSLYRAVAIARQLLGDGAGAAEPIELVRGRGYRFAAPLAAGARIEGDGLVAARGRSRRWRTRWSARAADSASSCWSRARRGSARRRW